MTAKILIKRKVSAEKAAAVAELAKRLSTLVISQPGYVSGESLKNVEKQNENLVISTWEDINAWKNWLASKERATIQQQIDALLGEKTEYEVYQYGR